jgi:hypothetical protein
MGDPYDELHVVLLAQCGDPAALETLLLRIQHALSRYISALVGHSAADDVMQEVFSVGVNLGGASYANSVKILNAIANLPREQSPRRPPA